MVIYTGSARAQLGVDKALYAVLPLDDHAKMAMDWQFPDAHADSVNPAEVDSLEGVIDSAYKAYIASNRFPHLLQPLNGYKRQYIALIDKNGDREIWINFFCGSFGIDWKHYAMVVDDGGGWLLSGPSISRVVSGSRVGDL